MLNRSRKPCKRPDCTAWVFRRKLCGPHYLEDFPPQPRPARKATPAKPRKPLKASRKAASRPLVNDVPEEVKTVVLARCGGRCEACGKPLTYGVHLHHRKRRRDGGHTADNLVALHPNCHVVAPEAVHQRPAWAKERGLIVSSWAQPVSTPLTLASGVRVLLHPTDAAYLPCPETLPLAG